MSYVPDNQGQFDQLLRAFRATETRDELRTVSVAFTLDMTYSRKDISTALSAVEREKGWHR